MNNWNEFIKSSGIEALVEMQTSSLENGYGLSPREAEVFRLAALGISIHEMGMRLFVTDKTIKFHLTNIYRKMGFKSRFQLVAWTFVHNDNITKTFHQYGPEKKPIEKKEPTDKLCCGYKT